MNRVGLAALCFAVALPCPAFAQLKFSERLETYESNAIGWTQDSDDVGFLDIKLSLKYRLFRLSRSDVYFAASTRFAQYLGTRESSPVVGKRFNPKLIWRQGANDGYFDLAFAHESNGQSVDTPDVFFRVQQEMERLKNGNPNFARDSISRGWDYLELAGRRSVPMFGAPRIDASFRVFLPEGPLQGPAEEHFNWEADPEGKPRRHVHGIAVLATWQLHKLKLAAGYETGQSRPFRYNTWRAEAVIDWGLPFLFFYQFGYGSDLALYYKRVSSWGIAVEIAGF